MLRRVSFCPVVAHMREEASPVWCRSDDEAVSKLGKGPAGNPGDVGIAAEGKKQAAGQNKEPAKVRLTHHSKISRQILVS